MSANIHTDATAQPAGAAILREYWQIVLRRRRTALAVGVAVAVVALGLALGLPSVYRAKATILIEQQEIPPELVPSTVTSYADQRIQMISQRVMTSANLLEVMDKFELFRDLRDDYPDEVAVEEMRERIDVDLIRADVIDPRTGRPSQATIAFSLSYDSRSPDMAQKVANELVSLYLRENLRTRTEAASETSLFLSRQVADLDRQLARLEKKLATFKEENVGLLPEHIGMKLQMLERLDQQLLEVSRQLSAAREQQIYQQSELSRLEPIEMTFTEDGKRILSSRDRLKILRSELIRLSGVYAPEHPDIMRLHKEIRALEGDVGEVAVDQELRRQLTHYRGELATARDKYSADHPDVQRLERILSNLQASLGGAGASDGAVQEPAPVSASGDGSAPDNPAFINLQTRLQATESHIAALQRQERELQQKRRRYEKDLIVSADVEQRYRQLTREYDNVRLKYQETKAKHLQARLAEDLEAQRKGERFTLIEPPMYPSSPESPNRAAILLLGMLAAVAGAVAGAFLMDRADDSVWGRRGVESLFQVPPLATVPYIETREDVERQLQRRKLARGSAAGGAVLAVVLIHALIMPLDLLWIVGLRRLGGLFG